MVSSFGSRASRHALRAGEQDTGASTSVATTTGVSRPRISPPIFLAARNCRVRRRTGVERPAVGILSVMVGFAASRAARAARLAASVAFSLPARGILSPFLFAMLHRQAVSSFWHARPLSPHGVMLACSRRPSSPRIVADRSAQRRLSSPWREVSAALSRSRKRHVAPFISVAIITPLSVPELLPASVAA